MIVERQNKENEIKVFLGNRMVGVSPPSNDSSGREHTQEVIRCVIRDKKKRKNTIFAPVSSSK